MSPIKAQIDYARTQPWFSNYIDALLLCDSDDCGGSIIDLIYWTDTDEGHDYWRLINDAASHIPAFTRQVDLELADLKPYLPDYPEIFL